MIHDVYNIICHIDMDIETIEDEALASMDLGGDGITNSGVAESHTLESDSQCEDSDSQLINTPTNEADEGSMTCSDTDILMTPESTHTHVTTPNRADSEGSTKSSNSSDSILNLGQCIDGISNDVVQADIQEATKHAVEDGAVVVLGSSSTPACNSITQQAIGTTTDSGVHTNKNPVGKHILIYIRTHACAHALISFVQIKV